MHRRDVPHRGGLDRRRDVAVHGRGSRRQDHRHQYFRAAATPEHQHRRRRRIGLDGVPEAAAHRRERRAAGR